MGVAGETIGQLGEVGRPGAQGAGQSLGGRFAGGRFVGIAAAAAAAASAIASLFGGGCWRALTLGRVALALALADFHFGARFGRDRTGLAGAHDNGALAALGGNLHGAVGHVYGGALCPHGHGKGRALYGGGQVRRADLKTLLGIFLDLEQQCAQGLNDVGEQAIAAAVTHFHVAVRRHGDFVLAPHQHGPATGAGYQPIANRHALADRNRAIAALPAHRSAYLAYHPAIARRLCDAHNLVRRRLFYGRRFAIHSQCRWRGIVGASVG